ncbi:MAG: FG-GAP-like repeat-containing protein [Planctomycetes bacterium]|nr:FG-GAP-like repeat-containing protein [Planctomycetota bacterium]
MIARATCLMTIIALSAALAAQPSVTSTTPARHANDVADNSNVSAGFSTNMSPPGSSSFRVHSNLRGWLAGAFSGGTTTALSFNPTSDLLPGEKLEVILTDMLESTGNAPLHPPQSWRFNAESSAGPSVWDVRDVTSGQWKGWDAAFGDIDGDGDIDMICAGNVTVGYDYKCINDGNGNFTNTWFTTNVDGSYCCALADMDSDGDLDILMGNAPINTGGQTYSGANRLYFNDGNGNFPTSTTFGNSTNNTIDLAVGDLDNDGDLDVVTANGAINPEQSYIYLNNGSGVLSQQPFLYIPNVNAPFSAATWEVELGDVNNDGFLDVISGFCGIALTATNYVWLNDGSAGFNLQNTITYETAAVVQSMAVGDFDGDGDLDMIGGGNGLCPSNVYLNTGSGAFIIQQWDAGTFAVWDLETNDMDGDGDLDVIVASESGVCYVMFNDGSANFSSTAAGNAPVGNNASMDYFGLTAADVDGDGDLDIGTPNNIIFNGSNLPTVTVTVGANSVANGGTANVNNNDTVLAAGITISINDPDNDQVSVSGQISNVTNQGFSLAEWSSGAAPVSYALTPTTGTFTQPNMSHTVTLTVNDGTETLIFTFHIDVGAAPNIAPTISVSTGSGPVTNNGAINVNYASTLQALSLAITVADADFDNVSLVGNVSNASGTAMLSSHFSSASAGTPYSLYPQQGTFNQPGVTHVVTLNANDGVGGTAAFTFNIVVSATPNYGPGCMVSRNGTAFSPNSSFNVNYGTTLASLSLVITVNDNNNDTVNLTGSVSNAFGTGILNSEFSGNAVAPYLLYPTTGVFNQPNTSHVVSLNANDGNGGNTVFTFTINVGAAPNDPPVIGVSRNATNVADSSVINVAYGATVASLQLAISVTDAQNDTVALTGTVSSGSGTGILNSEFSNSAPAPYTVNPTSGVFNIGGATHTVTLSADDGNGGTANFSFHVMVGAAPAPLIQVFETSITGVAISHGSNASGGRDFGSQLVSAGATTGLVVVIYNNGNAALDVTSVNLTGADAGHFVLNTTTTAGVVAPTGYTQFTLAFDPASAGSKTATVGIDHNDGSVANPFTFEVTGVGTTPAPVPLIVVKRNGATIANGGSINVGTYAVGDNPSLVTITIENAGNAALTVGMPTLGGADAARFTIILNGFNGLVPASGSTSFSIDYDAAVEGTHGATLSFSHDDTTTATPFSIALTGVTTAAPPSGGGSTGGGGGGGGGCAASGGTSATLLIVLLAMAALTATRTRRRTS